MLSDSEKKYLSEILRQLEKSAATLEFSFKKCININITNDLTEEDKDGFESLTAKFARLSDLIIKKAFRLLEVLDLEDKTETVRDLISNAEKKGLIEDEIMFLELRKFRNKIVHEYVLQEDDILDIYKFVIEKTQLLIDTVKNIRTYSGNYFI